MWHTWLLGGSGKAAGPNCVRPGVLDVGIDSIPIISEFTVKGGCSACNAKQRVGVPPFISFTGLRVNQIGQHGKEILRSKKCEISEILGTKDLLF